MYAEYFGLKEIPFRITPDQRFLWYSEQHLEAKQKILYHLTQSAGPIYLLAEDPPEQFKSRSIPATFILDKNGMIALRHIGAATWDDDSVVTFVRGLAATPKT